MNCPACGKEMAIHEFSGIEIDLCRFCGGIWFDAEELAGFIKKGTMPVRLLTVYCIEDSRERIHEGERFCPRCGNLLQVVEHRDTNVDFCFRCHGIWFDKGELKEMLLSYHREAETKRKNEKKTKSRAGTGAGSGMEKPAEDEHDTLIRALLEKPDQAPAGFWMAFADNARMDLHQELMAGKSAEEIAQALPRDIVRNDLLATGSPAGKGGKVQGASASGSGSAGSSFEKPAFKEKCEDFATKAFKDFFGSFFKKK